MNIHKDYDIKFQLCGANKIGSKILYLCLKLTNLTNVESIDTHMVNDDGITN